ncbi:MAG: sarcosine oxidase subunit gamma [Pseudomonadota bacterium]
MASLIEKTACDGLLPLAAGPLSLAEVDIGPIVSVAPFLGRLDAVDAALGKLGLGFPAPNTTITAGTAAIVWTGREQAFLIGADGGADGGMLEGLAALTDQSDGWAVMELAGQGWRDALARLVGIDLRPRAFLPGQAARTPLNHMPAVIWCLAEDRVRIMCFRSMAKTAVHELHAAMASVAARARG